MGNRPLLLITLLGLLAACEVPEPADLAECTNPEVGYTVSYPEGWHTNTGEVMDPCALFDPEPIEIEPATEIPADIAVAIRAEHVPFEQMTQNFFGQREISREPDEIHGRQAFRIELENTEDLLLPAGTRSYNYYVDLGDRTLIAVTYDVGEPPYNETGSVLDLMMATLRFQ